MQSVIEASNTEGFNNGNKDVNVSTDTIANVDISDLVDMSSDEVHHEMHNNPSLHENLFQDSIRNKILTHYNRIVIGSFKEFFQSFNTNNLVEVPQAIKELNFMLANRAPELTAHCNITTLSICNKINQFQHYLLENSIDVCAVMETWLKEDEEYGLYEIPPLGFKIISKPRCDGRQGGGIALIYKEYYTINDHKINTNSQYMELSAFDLHIQDQVIDLLVIYRYPNTSVVSFCNDLGDILGNNILTLKGHCILTGDFNIHIDDVLDNDTRTCNDMLDSLGVINHITFPTQHRDILSIYLLKKKIVHSS